MRKIAACDESCPEWSYLTPCKEISCKHINAYSTLASYSSINLKFVVILIEWYKYGYLTENLPRPIMKEYQFTPSSKMLTITEGLEVEVELLAKRVAFRYFTETFCTIYSIFSDPYYPYHFFDLDFASSSF